MYEFVRNDAAHLHCILCMTGLKPKQSMDACTALVYRRWEGSSGSNWIDQLFAYSPYERSRIADVSGLDFASHAPMVLMCLIQQSEMA
jgi:hypothetical protein